MVRKPSSLSSVSTTNSRTSSNYPPSVLSTSWDADDEQDSTPMSADEDAPTRPISVAIPKSHTTHGPYCPRKPFLREILANTSDPPWTLTAFMAYLSSNLCLELLEFTMDAGRYKKHYAKMISKSDANGVPASKDSEYVQELWERLVEAYIQPSGSREVNIPSSVRDPILSIKADKMPPLPETLDPAVAKVYELMEESVLVPFLNSVYPQSTQPTVGSCPPDPSADAMYPSKTAPNPVDRATNIRRGRQSQHSPPPQTVVEPYSNSYSPPSAMHRKSAPPLYKASGNKVKQTTSNPARTSAGNLVGEASGSDVNVSGSASGVGMTDDSGSTDSPGNDSPSTPPTTPPLSDTQSPSSKRDSGMWKKLGRLSGMKATKRSEGKLREEQ